MATPIVTDGTADDVLTAPRAVRRTRTDVCAARAVRFDAGAGRPNVLFHPGTA